MAAVRVVRTGGERAQLAHDVHDAHGRVKVGRVRGRSERSVVSRPVGLTVAGVTRSRRGVTHLPQRGADLLLESNTLSNTGSGVLI